MVTTSNSSNSRSSSPSFFKNLLMHKLHHCLENSGKNCHCGYDMVFHSQHKSHILGIIFSILSKAFSIRIPEIATTCKEVIV